MSFLAPFLISLSKKAISGSVGGHHSSTMHFLFCKCPRRVGCMIIAAVSAIHFVFVSTAVAMVGESHRAASENWSDYYLMLIFQVLMVLFSVSLFVGAYFRIVWFCVPWLVLTAIHLLYHLYVFFVLCAEVVTEFSWTKLGMFAIILLSTISIGYMFYVVLGYALSGIGQEMPDDDEDDDNDKHNDEENMPLMSSNSKTK